MFNFQKEVVLNNPKDQIRIANITSSTVEVEVSPRMQPKMLVHGGGEYFGKYIVDGKVYRTSPVKGVNAKVTLKPTVLATIDSAHIQILIELGLDSDYRGDFGSAVWYFRKPILVDVTTEGLTADSLVKAFNTAIPKEYKFVKVRKEGTNVVLEGADSYIKVRNVQIIGFTCETRCEGSSEEPTVIASMENTTTGIKIGNYGIVDINSVEFGTYNYLIQNLRLPTYANLRFSSPSAVEMPMQGTDYVQYSFAYCVPRGINFGGMSVAGQTNHSTTLHTFFVPDTKNGKDGRGNKAFEDYLSQILGPDDFIEDMVRKVRSTVTVLPDAYASAQDLKAAEATKDNASAITANSNADAALKTQVNKNKTAIKNAHPGAAV